MFREPTLRKALPRSLWHFPLILWVAVLCAHGQAPQRAVAITFDDLPAQPAAMVSADVAALRSMTQDLLARLRENRVPAIGFVNESKLEPGGEKGVAQRTEILGLWVEAGLELGNHTYSHPGLQRTPLAEFQQDVIRGEPVTRRLLAAHGMKLRYFRHPFLQVGPDLATRQAFEKFLAQRGYTIAPVTIDNGDYIFAAVYARARAAGEEETAARTADAYLDHMDEMFVFFEGVSRSLLDREVKQVLLLHANQLNADVMARLLERIRLRGYRFITLEEALTDPAYQLPDTYTGPWGISWLHHWAVTRGEKRAPDPDPPPWVMELYNRPRN